MIRTTPPARRAAAAAIARSSSPRPTNRSSAARVGSSAWLARPSASSSAWLGPLAAGLLLATVSPRLTIAALIAPTLIAAVLGTMSESIRQAPPLDELTKASPAASAT